MSKIDRYKIGYSTDDWGMRSSTPSGLLDSEGAWVRYTDHCAAPAAAPAQPVAVPEGMEPCAYMFQNDDTGQVQFVDAQQVEWGFEKNNPRLIKVGPLFTLSQVQAMLAAAPLNTELPPTAAVEAARPSGPAREPLTDEQIGSAIEKYWADTTGSAIDVINAEVREQDDALIRQMLEALLASSPTDASYAWRCKQWAAQRAAWAALRAAAINAARLRLEGKP